jgi:hypothetical protein
MRRDEFAGPSSDASQRPVLVGIVGMPPAADAAVRAGFAYAEARAATLRVVCAGAASVDDDAFLIDLVDRWAEKYPLVPVTFSVRRAIDAAVTLTAAARSCGLLVVPASDEPGVAAVTKALVRRSGRPVVLV